MRKLFVLLFFVTYLSGFAHPWNPNKYIVIDTDGGIDDYRTLCLLLSANDIRVLGITTSNGVLDADKAAIKVKALLNSLYHEGIPVAINTHTKNKGKSCPTAMGFAWGDEDLVNSQEFISIDSLANYLARNCREKVEFISLGSLSTAHYLMSSHPEYAKMTDRIIWSNYAMFPLKGFNYEADSSAAFSLTQLNVPIHVIQGGGEYTGNCVKEIESLELLPARKLSRSFSNDVFNSLFGKRMFDEMVAVYLHYPEKFLRDSIKRITFYKMGINHKEEINNSIMNILKENDICSNQIINQLPPITSFYKPDVQTFMEKIIAKHGFIEWNAVVMTFELHRHVGSYALIGAKMGIRALEYFGAGIDELNVCSYAGIKPPVSCMNDGIQVSTGATLGHGLIQVVEDNPISVADFTYMDRTIKIKLKDEISEKISNEIKGFVKMYGLSSDKYWNAVRESAINYWLSLDRHEIFDITN